MVSLFIATVLAGVLALPNLYFFKLSIQDRTDQSILLPARDLSKYQAILGDMIWLQRLSKPEIIFAHQHLSRITKPTLYDYKLGLHVLHYCIGTADKIRWLGGPHGPIITASVDSSFASHSDLKSIGLSTLVVAALLSVMLRNSLLLPIVPQLLKSPVIILPILIVDIHPISLKSLVSLNRLLWVLQMIISPL